MKKKSEDIITLSSEDEEEFEGYRGPGWVYENPGFVQAGPLNNPNLGGAPGPRGNILPGATALVYFLLIWTDELWSIVLDETNRYE